MLAKTHDLPLCPPDSAAISYTLLQHLGLMLDELSAQMLLVWRDERQAWQWAATDLRSTHGFWALGEAIVDAVAARYPAAFEWAETALHPATSARASFGSETS
jgi:hypothetical protein